MMVGRIILNPPRIAWVGALGLPAVAGIMRPTCGENKNENGAGNFACLSITTLVGGSMPLRLAPSSAAWFLKLLMSAGKILLVVLGAFVALVLICVLWILGIFNNLVTLQQGTDAAWAQVQNVYQRRADLVPNLVNTVSGAANFEKSTLTEITEARASVGRVQLPAGGAPQARPPTAARSKVVRFRPSSSEVPTSPRARNSRAVPSGSDATSSAARAEPKADSSAPKLTGPSPETDRRTTQASRSKSAAAAIESQCR